MLIEQPPLILRMLYPRAFWRQAYGLVEPLAPAIKHQIEG